MNTNPHTNAALPLEALDYELPATRIATRPAQPRDSARLLVMRRSDEMIEHRLVRDLPEYLDAGDLLVFNDTAVLPARFLGRRLQTAGRVEGLFLAEIKPGRWSVLLKSNGRLRAGIRIALLDATEQSSAHALELVERRGDQWIVELARPEPAHAVLAGVGRTPLPPYIRRARGGATVSDATDRAWYETVYADAHQRHSVAAPTAGLHFTPELLEKVRRTGARSLTATLHVGVGTFAPITAARLDEHRMHEESYEVPAEVIAALATRLSGRADDAPQRTIAVGTTTVRLLESLTDPLPDPARSVAGRTDLFIAPGHRFRHVDGVLTNFHLPRSSLLALVGALVGLERLKSVYQVAIDAGYRFYSYGDAMLILP